MKKILMIVFGIYLGTLSFSEIKVAIHEPIRFKNVNTKAYGDIVVGEGAIEIFSTDIKEDYNKKVKIRFPEKGLLTNKKRWLTIEKFRISKADENFVVEKEKKIVKLYAFIKRREINKNDEDGSMIEGEYVGNIPLIVEVYGKPINSVEEGIDRPNLLPSFPDLVDRPTILPSFLDEEELSNL